jgi:hypothetical protein
VKCDEAKPAPCMRCSSTGRVCGGYEIDQDLHQEHSPNHNSITLYRPKQLAARDEQEGRSFNFFAHVVSPVLSGPMDSYFWTHLVMQFSHFTPAVRHASISVSSLYEDFVNGSRIHRPRSNLLALKHYNAAIQEVGANPDQDEQLVLIVCILFVCIELLQGNPEGATQHCKYGLAILEKFAADPDRSPSDWVVQYLLPIFRRLSLNLLIPVGSISHTSPPSIPKPKLLLLENSPGTPDIPDRFSTIFEVSNSLDRLMVRCKLLGQSKNDMLLDQWVQERNQLEESLELWYSRVLEFESSISHLDVPEKLALCNMRMACEKDKVNLHIKSGPMKTFVEELAYDDHLQYFKSMVSEARYAAQLSSSLKARQPFSFEMGFLPLLLFVVLKCRDLDTRLEALSWMPHLTAAKESLLDLGTLYRVSRRVIEIEHHIFLDDNLNVFENETTRRRLSPTDTRIIGAPVDHEMEVLTREDGSISYRRKVPMIMGHADGTTTFDREVLNERPLRQFDLVIPGMRSAR